MVTIKDSLENIHTNADANAFFSKLVPKESTFGGRKYTIAGETGELSLKDITDYFSKLQKSEKNISCEVWKRIAKIDTNSEQAKAISEGYAVTVGNSASTSYLRSQLSEALLFAVNHPGKDKWNKLHELLLDFKYEPEVIKRVMEYFPSKNFALFVEKQLDKKIFEKDETDPKAFQFRKNLKDVLSTWKFKDDLGGAVNEQLYRVLANVYYSTAVESDGSRMGRQALEALQKLRKDDKISNEWDDFITSLGSSDHFTRPPSPASSDTSRASTPSPAMTKESASAPITPPRTPPMGSTTPPSSTAAGVISTRPLSPQPFASPILQTAVTPPKTPPSGQTTIATAVGTQDVKEAAAKEAPITLTTEKHKVFTVIEDAKPKTDADYEKEASDKFDELTRGDFNLKSLKEFAVLADRTKTKEAWNNLLAGLLATLLEREINLEALEFLIELAPKTDQKDTWKKHIDTLIEQLGKTASEKLDLQSIKNFERFIPNTTDQKKFNNLLAEICSKSLERDNDAGVLELLAKTAPKTGNKEIWQKNIDAAVDKFQKTANDKIDAKSIQAFSKVSQFASDKDIRKKHLAEAIDKFLTNNREMNQDRLAVLNILSNIEPKNPKLPKYFDELAEVFHKKAKETSKLQDIQQYGFVVDRTSNPKNSNEQLAAMYLDYGNKTNDPRVISLLNFIGPKTNNPFNWKVAMLRLLSNNIPIFLALYAPEDRETKDVSKYLSLDDLSFTPSEISLLKDFKAGRTDIKEVEELKIALRKQAIRFLLIQKNLEIAENAVNVTAEKVVEVERKLREGDANTTKADKEAADKAAKTAVDQLYALGNPIAQAKEEMDLMAQAIQINLTNPAYAKFFDNVFDKDLKNLWEKSVPNVLKPFDFMEQLTQRGIPLTLNDNFFALLKRTIENEYNLLLDAYKMRNTLATETDPKSALTKKELNAKIEEHMNNVAIITERIKNAQQLLFIDSEKLLGTMYKDEIMFKEFNAKWNDLIRKDPDLSNKLQMMYQWSLGNVTIEDTKT